MRKTILFLMLGCFALLLSSCNKEIQNEKEEEQTTYMVSLSFGGDITVTDEPLTKGTPTNDLYGINVYYDVNKDGNINANYAYGLFDNIGDMTIPLLSGYKYTFKCTLIKDGKTKLESSNIGKYEAPFSQILENKFVLGTNTQMGIGNGPTRLKGASRDISIPKLDRYYGETHNYVPAAGGQVIINLVRVSFGAKFIVTGLVNDGTLTASCRTNNDLGSGTEEIWSISTTEDIEGSEVIYAIPTPEYCFNSIDTYTLNGTVSINYSSNRGSHWDITKTEPVVWKRNVLTTVTINVSPDMSGGTVSISEEVLGDDNVINIGINGDGVIDTDVVPTV